MNSMEQAPGEYRLKITGLSIRQIKDIFENEYGALMWSGGGAYPCDGVTLQFKSTDGPTALPDHSEQHLDMVAALPVGELTDEQIDKVGVRFPGDQMVLRGFARAILAAASSQPVRKPQPFVVATETWFENGKLITRNLTAEDVYKPAVSPQNNSAKP